MPEDQQEQQHRICRLAGPSYWPPPPPPLLLPAAAAALASGSSPVGDMKAGFALLALFFPAAHASPCPNSQRPRCVWQHRRVLRRWCASHAAFRVALPAPFHSGRTCTKLRVSVRHTSGFCVFNQQRGPPARATEPPRPRPSDRKAESPPPPPPTPRPSPTPAPILTLSENIPKLPPRQVSLPPITLPTGWDYAVDCSLAGCRKMTAWIDKATAPNTAHGGECSNMGSCDRGSGIFARRVYSYHLWQLCPTTCTSALPSCGSPDVHAPAPRRGLRGL